MAFDATDLHLIGGGNGVRQWLYTTADTIATVNTVAYFDGETHNMFSVGDMIVTVTSTGGTVVVGHSYFTAVGSGTTDIVDGVAITNTDGD